MKKLLNFEYACIQGTYWMLYGIFSSFASVFLLARGYSNAEIGVILAAANVAAVVLQPLAADLADRSAKVSLIGLTQGMTVMMMVMTIGLFAFQKKSLALAVIFVLLVAWHTILQPLINSLNFRLQECGVHINFGMARSLGSLTYSILMAILGTVVENHGTQVLPLTGEVIMVMLLLSLFLTRRQYKKARRLNLEKGTVREKPEAEEEAIDLAGFVRRNRVFFIVNIGVIGLYFSNSILNNYMMQIVSGVGGDSGDMGRILSLMAFLEIPTMFCFDALRKRFSCQLMLKAAAVGFTVKIALCWLAESVAMIFAAQIFQLVSFALFLPAMVHFIDEIMSRGEAVKGQALFTMMTTVTTVFSSLAGGLLLDISGAKMLTLVSTLVTAAGAAVIILSVDRVKSSRKRR